MHPVLSPGTHVLRRCDGALQVGLDPELAALLPPEYDDPRPFSPVTGSPGLRDCAALPALVRDRLALPDDHALRSGLPADDEAGRWPRHAVAALCRHDPERLRARLRARAGVQVRVAGPGHPLSGQLAEDLRGLLAREGLPLAGPRRPGPPTAEEAAREPVYVLVSVGEPARALLDPLLRGGHAHLVVRLAEGRAVVGPFVVPGATPCLRCLDAHHADADPSWGALLEQYAARATGDRPDGIPEPVDPALAALALAWAARDVTSYAEGDDPVSLAATVRLHHGLRALETRRWEGHPRCGCGAGAAARTGPDATAGMDVS